MVVRTWQVTRRYGWMMSWYGWMMSRVTWTLTGWDTVAGHCGRRADVPGEVAGQEGGGWFAVDCGRGRSTTHSDFGTPFVRGRKWQAASRYNLGATRGPTLTSWSDGFRKLTGGCEGCSEIAVSRRMGGPRSDG